MVERVMEYSRFPADTERGFHPYLELGTLSLPVVWASGSD